MQDQAIDRESAARSSIAAWTVVGICFAVLSVSFAARSLLGLSMPYLEKDLGWTRGFVSIGGATSLVVMAAMSPIAGNMIDRFGARVLLFGGLMVNMHDVNLAKRIADRVVGMAGGRIVFDGKPDGLRTDELSTVYGGEDWMR